MSFRPFVIALALLAAGPPARAQSADRPAGNCEVQRIETVRLSGGRPVPDSVRAAAVADVAFWLRPAPPTSYVRTASVRVRLDRARGLEIAAPAAAADSAFARAALNAVQMAAHDGRFEPFVGADSTAADTVTVWFGTDDRGRATAFGKRAVCLAVPRPGNPQMAYPQALRTLSDAPASYSDVVHPKDSKSGVVRALFRVDSTGAVVPGAIAIVSSPNEAFSRVVLEVLPGYRYFPATIDGRPTPQVVQQDFEFALHYGPNRP